MAAETDPKILSLFQSFDVDGNGYISFDELRTGLEQRGKAVTAAEVQAIIKEVDADNDCEISLDEFTEIMNRAPDKISPVLKPLYGLYGGLTLVMSPITSTVSLGLQLTGLTPRGTSPIPEVLKNGHTLMAPVVSTGEGDMAEEEGGMATECIIDVEVVRAIQLMPRAAVLYGGGPPEALVKVMHPHFGVQMKKGQTKTAPPSLAPQWDESSPISVHVQGSKAEHIVMGLYDAAPKATVEMGMVLVPVAQLIDAARKKFRDTLEREPSAGATIMDIKPNNQSRFLVRPSPNCEKVQGLLELRFNCQFLAAPPS